MAHFSCFFDADELADGLGVETRSSSEKTALRCCNYCCFWMRAEAGMVVLRQLFFVVSFVDRGNLVFDVGDGAVSEGVLLFRDPNLGSGYPID